MKKNGIKLDYDLPSKLQGILKNHHWETVNIGCSKSDVFRLENQEGMILYLKTSIPETKFDFNNNASRWPK